MIELKIHTNIKPFLQEGGAQQREFHREIQQAKQVGDGPQQRGFHREIQQKASWGRPQQKNFNVNSTSLTPLLD